MHRLGPWIAAAARGAAEVVLAFPLLFVAAIYSVPHGLIAWWMIGLAFCYGIGYAFARLLPAAPRPAAVIFSACAAAGLFLTLAGPGSAGAWIGAVCGFVLIIRGWRSANAVWGDHFPIQAMWIAVAVYVPVAVAFRIAERLQPEAVVLLWLGMAALAVAIFAANETRLKRESKSGGRGAVAPSIRRVNRFYTVLVLALIALVGSFGMIRSWLSGQLSVLFHWFAGLFASKAGKLNNELELDPSGPFQLPEETAAHGDPLWMNWLIRIVFILAAVAFCVFLIFILYKLGKRLRVLLDKIARWIAGGSGGAGDGAETGYEDTKESLLDWKNMRAGLTDRMPSWLSGDREPKWGQLQDNRERIRWLYRKLVRSGIRQGYAFRPHFTPVETASDLAVWQQGRTSVPMGKLGQMYSRARYGDESQSFDEAELEAMYRESEQWQGGNDGRKRK